MSPGALNTFSLCFPNIHLCIHPYCTRFCGDCMKKEDGFPLEEITDRCSFICP